MVKIINILFVVFFSESDKKLNIDSLKRWIEGWVKSIGIIFFRKLGVLDFFIKFCI